MKRSSSLPHDLAVRTVRPNRNGYVHRDLLTIVDDQGMTENGVVVDDIPLYARDATPTIFVTLDASRLLALLDDRWGDHPGWNFRLLKSGDREESGMMERVRLDRFGLRIEGRKKQAMHLVWSPGDMAPSPTARFLVGGQHIDLMSWAKDFRDFHRENDIPLATTFAGTAAKFLRDPRFYPDPRRRVPRATNERIRPYLPGVHQEFRGKTYARYNGASLDQTRAFHHVVQEVALPDANTLFARGYFQNLNDAPYWCAPGDQLYDRTIQQPGVVVLGGHMTKTGQGTPYRLPALDFHGYRRIALWTNEVPLAKSLGFTIEGMVAAWTSVNTDQGLARYGAWALTQLDTATPARLSWLKPTLHAAYGILGARPRQLKFGYKRSAAGERAEYLFGVRVFTVQHIETKGKLQPPTANVPQLGTIQAEVRRRTLELANELESYEGVQVPHIHADGLHVTGPLPLHLAPPAGWTIEPVTNLTYADPVSWVSDEGAHLPGRATGGQERLRVIELARNAPHVQGKIQTDELPYALGTLKVGQATRLADRPLGIDGYRPLDPDSELGA